MILVCLSHVRHHFESTAPALYSLVTMTTRVATPTFLLLSGFVIGHLLRGNSVGKVGLALVDRGLFLLIVAHTLIGLTQLPGTDFAEWWLGRAMITDVVGIALFAAVLVRRASAAALFAAGCALCIPSWIVAMTWLPASEGMQLVGSLLFYLDAAPSSTIEVPLLSYLGVFLIGMALSAWFRDLLLVQNYRALAVRLSVIGSAAVLLAVTGIVLWHFGKNAVAQVLSEPYLMRLLRATLNPGSKLPPGPSYMLFYGGLGLLMTAAFCAIRTGRFLGPMARLAIPIGRASLLCFVLQDWLFFLLPELLGYAAVSSVPFWLAYFAVGVLALHFISRAWMRIQGNRFLTVGLKWLVRRVRPRAPSALQTTDGPA